MFFSFLNFEKSSFLMKTMLLKKIRKLGVAYKENNRNPRRVSNFHFLLKSVLSVCLLVFL